MPAVGGAVHASGSGTAHSCRMTGLFHSPHNIWYCAVALLRRQFFEAKYAELDAGLLSQHRDLFPADLYRRAHAPACPPKHAELGAALPP